MYSSGYLIFLITLCRILIIKKVDLYLKRLQKIKCKLRLLANAPIETGRLTSLIPITRSKIFAEIKILDFFSAISKNKRLDISFIHIIYLAFDEKYVATKDIIAASAR